jgi:hypothetical protein
LKPNEALADWYKKLTPEERVETAFLIFATLPSVSPLELENPEALESEFLNFLNGESGEPEFKLLGKVLCVRALITWIIHKRATPRDWAETRELLERIADSAESKGRSSAGIKDELDRLPFRSKRWIKAAESWRKLCATVLSDKSIADWEKELFSIPNER